MQQSFWCAVVFGMVGGCSSKPSHDECVDAFAHLLDIAAASRDTKGLDKALFAEAAAEQQLENKLLIDGLRANRFDAHTVLENRRQLIGAVQDYGPGNVKRVGGPSPNSVANGLSFIKQCEDGTYTSERIACSLHAKTIDELFACEKK